jgi:hypothetical protein
MPGRDWTKINFSARFLSAIIRAHLRLKGIVPAWPPAAGH